MIGILQDLASKPWLHETISATEPRKRRASFLLATGTTIGYVLILPYVGFFFTNLIFLPCFAYVAGYRRLRVIPISVISAVVLSFAFQKLLAVLFPIGTSPRSEEHTSELQSLMRISYAVFCLTKETKI